mgnify:CR=1 FL=1
MSSSPTSRPPAAAAAGHCLVFAARRRPRTCPIVARAGAAARRSRRVRRTLLTLARAASRLAEGVEAATGLSGRSQVAERPARSSAGSSPAFSPKATPTHGGRRLRHQRRATAFPPELREPRDLARIGDRTPRRSRSRARRDARARSRAATRICSTAGSMLFSTPGGRRAPPRPARASLDDAGRARSRRRRPASTIEARCSCMAIGRASSSSDRVSGNSRIVTSECNLAAAVNVVYALSDRRRQYQHRARRVRRRPARSRAGGCRRCASGRPTSSGCCVDGLFAHSRIERVKIRGVILGSVVPPLTGTIRQMVEAGTSASPRCIVEPGVNTGMPILYENPAEVGADRIVNAVAAYEKFGKTPAAPGGR